MSRVSDCTPTLVILSTRLSPFWRILTFYSQPVCHWARVQDMRRLMMHAGGGWGSTRVMGTVGTVRTSVYPYDHPPGTHYPGQYTSGTLIPGLMTARPLIPGLMTARPLIPGFVVARHLIPGFVVARHLIPGFGD